MEAATKKASVSKLLPEAGPEAGPGLGGLGPGCRIPFPAVLRKVAVDAHHPRELLVQGLQEGIAIEL